MCGYYIDKGLKLHRDIIGVEMMKILSGLDVSSCRNLNEIYELMGCHIF